MKKIHLFKFASLLSIILTAQIGHAKVPTSWIHPQQQGMWALAPQKEQENNFDKDLNKMLKSSYSIISPSLEQKESYGLDKLQQKDSHGPWYLASMKTELGIEAGGEIGLVGVEGEAAIEYIWQRTARSIKKLQKKAYGSDIKPSVNLAENSFGSEPNSLELSTDMSQKQVSERVDNLVLYVNRTGKVRNLGNLRQQLLKHVTMHQEYAQQMAFASEQMTWKPYKYQLEVFVQGSGQVVPAVHVGAVLRLRIEWSIRERNSLVAANVPGDFVNHANFLTNELSMSLAQKEKSNNMFALYGVKLGLGIGAGGSIDIAKIKGHVIASVFLKYNPPSNSFVNAANFAGNDVIGGLTVNRWKSGLKKAGAMANYITEHSSVTEKRMDETRPLRDFELGALEVELELTAQGEFLLPTVKGIAFMEIFYTKKNKLKP